MDEPLTTTRAERLPVGGRKTVPFIIAGVVGVGVGAYAMMANLPVYLLEKYNVQPVEGTVIFSVMGGSTNLAPIVGAVISDTCLSCFTVIAVACAASLLAMLLFTLTAVFPFLRPPPCSSGPCKPPAPWQLGIIYAAIALVTVGLGGTRFTPATFGAAQFDEAGERETFFSWHVIGLYVSSIIGITGIIYIEEYAGWIVGFGLSAVIAALGLVFFLVGSPYYRNPKPDKNAFVDIFRKIVSGGKKRKKEPSEDLWHYNKLETGESAPQTSNESLSSPNEEAMIEQVEPSDDLGTLLRLIPLISTGIVLSLYLSVQISVIFLQALVMNRRLGPYVSIPLGSMSIFMLIAASISIPLLDHVFYPACGSLMGKPPTPLQRVGLGFLITTLAMVYGALSESKRLEALRTSSEPFSVLWLVPGLALVGLGEALHFPGQLAFFFQEFPASLKGSGTAVSALQSGIASFLTSTIITFFHRFNGWIQDDANESRLDYVYWILAVTGVLNFGCFLVFASVYGTEKRRHLNHI